MKMSINYIMEIRLFYDRLEIAPLPPTAIALWHGLMYLANKSGWPQEISIPVSTLEVRSGLERRSVYRARDVLREKGLINFRERSGNQCAVYRIIPLAGLLYDFDTQNSTQDQPQDDICVTDLTQKVSHRGEVLCESVTQSGTQTDPCRTDLSHSMSPLYKHNISSDTEDKDKRGSGGKKKSGKPSTAKKTDFDLSFIGDPVWENLVRTWLDYKKSRGEGYKSDLSVKKLHTMLRNISHGDPALAAKIIDKSIASNWAGLFELTGRSGDTEIAGTPNRTGRPASGQRIGQIKQPADEERRQKLLAKFGRSDDTGSSGSDKT